MAARAGTDGTTPGEGDAAAGTTAPADPGTAPAGDPAAPEAAGVTQPATGAAPQDSPPAAAPLTAPVKRNQVREAPPGAVDAAAAVREAPGDGRTTIVGHDGEPLSPGDLFTEAAPHHTFLEAARDIFEKFRYPGQHRDSHQHTMQLVARAGTQIPRDKAHEIIEAARNGGTPAGSGGEGPAPAV